jgi:hypothetical protein
LLLVVVGALSAAKHWSVLLNSTVWAMAFVAFRTAVNSIFVKDYFDFNLGEDTVNAPEKPLPRYLLLLNQRFVTHGWCITQQWTLCV